MGNLKSMVMTAIMTWLIQRVVMAAVKKIISMFNPVSGIISILMSLWNVIQFVIEKARQIMMLATAVFGTLAPLVKGDVKKAADQVERALAIVLPLALGFLAGMLGLGKIVFRGRPGPGYLMPPANRLRSRWWNGSSLRFGCPAPCRRSSLFQKSRIHSIWGSLCNARDQSTPGTKGSAGEARIFQCNQGVKTWDRSPPPRHIEAGGSTFVR
ncbi:MAG: hypothetical protein GY856_33495 [bacterium]|nr:hypothetical protein [bacterium]